MGKMINIMILIIIFKEMKRKLSKLEIDNLFSDFDSFFPKYLDKSLRNSTLQQVKNSLIEEFEKYEVYPEIIPNLKKCVNEKLKQCVIPAGEMVGVICAQSIGERQTQLTLNSFHQAGLTVNTVITGVPRFLEILNATKEPKMTTNRFALNTGKVESISEIKQIIGDTLRYFSWKDVIEEETLHLEKEEEPWYGSFEHFYNGNFRSYKTCISYQINKEIFYINQLSLPKIRDIFENMFKTVYVVFSPLHIGQVDIFLDLDEIRQTEYFVEKCAKSSFTLQVFIEDVIRPKLGDVSIAGIPKISDFFVSKNGPGDFVIDTEGSNLKDILKLPYVDQRSIRTNHMWEVYEIFGIEGTRKFLLEELRNIVSSDGTFINECHLMILVDLMTNNGLIQSISRYGVKKDQNSVLTRSSFEESLEHFSKAAFFSEKEHIQSVSSSIMCGKRSNIGTGICSVMVDWDKL